MAKLIEWLKGKKSYLVAIVVGLLAALQSLGVAIPEYIYALLAAFGIAAVRASIK